MHRFRKTYLLQIAAMLVFLVSPALVVPTFAAETVMLAQGGKALATIEIAPNASVATRSVATEMAGYLQQITGARFDVVNQAGPGTRIVLGRNDEFPNLDYGDRLHGIGQEGFLIRTERDGVILLGASDRATSHAAYAFLEKLGVRWFFPTKEWEIVPSIKTLSASFDEVQSPDMTLHRDIWYGSMTGYTTANHLRLSWMRHNRMKTDGPLTSHSWIGLDPVKDFKEHPEWFALVKGERRNSKPNYGHPEVIKKAIASSLAAAEKGAKSITVSAPDGLGFCECDQCLEVAGVSRDSVYIHNAAIFGKRPDGVDVCVTSETIFRMANQVAKAVGEKYPNVLIGVFAYSGYAHPPSFDLEPNIYVAVTSLYRRTPLPFDDQIRVYGEKSKQLGIYDYYHVAVFYGSHPSKGPKMRDLAERMKFYHENQVLGVNAEGTNNWLPAGLDNYVASKLMWNVDADVEAIYADFLEKAFGVAEAPMRSYYDRWESKTELTSASIGGALDDLIKAYRMADSPAAKTRIAQLYLYNRFLHLEMVYRQATKDNDPKVAEKAGEEYSNIYWRLKDTFLMHDLVTRGVHRPLVPGYTAQELETLMAEDAAWIEKNRGLFLTYSRKLVPITSAQKNIPGVVEQAVSTGRFRKFGLIVPAEVGETIEIEIAPDGEKAPYRVGFMTPEVFHSGAGDAMAEAILSAEAKEVISHKAERTGFYFIRVDGATFKQANKPHVVNHVNMDVATLYFYVPAGTKEFLLKANAYAGPTISVRDAAGNVVFDRKGFAGGVRDKKLPGALEATIAVPPGTDGAVWSMTGPGDVNRTASMGVEGIPIFMSFTPQQLLVAEEYLK